MAHASAPSQRPRPGDADSLPRMLDARYRLERKLGQGGMGVVYLGLHVDIERQVAIKILRHDQAESKDLAERFLREARAAVKIRHENVVEVIDFGRAEGGDLYFVMEYLEGKSLSEVLAESGRIPPRRTIGIGRQVCSAMAAAHALGIIHRDLKAANVLVIERSGRPDFVKVLDFGVAKLLGDSEGNLTRSGLLVGTLNCMAPEQITGGTVDARSDIYSLGVLLYRMLSGEQVFTGDNMAAVGFAHVNAAPVPLRTRAPDANVPEELERVVMRCLAKTPAARFQSMDELESALAAALADAPKDEAVVAPRRPALSPEIGTRPSQPRPRLDPPTLSRMEGQHVRPPEKPVPAEAPRSKAGWIAAGVLLGLGALVAVLVALRRPEPASPTAIPEPVARAVPAPAAPMPVPEPEPERAVEPAAAAPSVAADPAPSGAQANAEGSVTKPGGLDILEVGRQLEEQRQWSSAVRLYETALKLEPLRPELSLHLGLAFHELGDRRNAARHLERFLALAPSHADAPRVRALLAAPVAPRRSAKKQKAPGSGTAESGDEAEEEGFVPIPL